MLRVQLKPVLKYLAMLLSAFILISGIFHPKLQASLNSSAQAKKIRQIYGLKPERGRFLVASEKIKSHAFSKTVILLLEHNSEGSTGLIINSPTDVQLSKVFSKWNKSKGNRGILYRGGPVNNSSFYALFISDKSLPSSQHITGKLYSTSSMSTLEYLWGHSESTKDFKVYEGYAGWWSGQLLRELNRGSWYVVEGDIDMVIDPPDNLWEFMMKRKRTLDRSGN